MKFAGIQEIRKELQLLPPKRLQELCLRMARYRKENKELLAFLLFESDSTDTFISEVKTWMSDEFSQLSEQRNLFYLKKGLRRILRTISRYMKYADDKTTSVELLLFFCQQIATNKIPVHNSAQLRNIYEQQIKKIGVLIGALHEDKQQDYLSDLKELR